MKLILLGAPGAGKGTQGVQIAEHFGVEHLPAGDQLRAEVAERTPLGVAAQSYMSRGDFVPDDLVIEMMIARMESATEKYGGYVLDGFPRTLPQARAAAELAAERGVSAQVALLLRADDDELVRRLLLRGRSGARSDDTEEVIRHRLELFHEKTQPMIDYYAEQRGILAEVDAQKPVDEVTNEILAVLGTLDSQDAPAPGSAGTADETVG